MAEWFETKIKGLEGKSPLSYREPGPLECPGTEAYFNAVMGSLRREAAARPGAFTEIPAKASRVKVRVIRTDSDSLSPQHCDGCGRFMAGEDCKTFSLFPAVFCLACSPKLEDKAMYGSSYFKAYGTLESARIAPAVSL